MKSDLRKAMRTLSLQRHSTWEKNLNNGADILEGLRFWKGWKLGMELVRDPGAERLH